METTGKVIHVLPKQGGIGKQSGKEWAKQEFVIETFGQYPKKQHFELFGEDRIKANLPEVDAQVKVSFDLESDEFNGRWYTHARAFKVEPAIDAQPMAAQPMPAAAPQPQQQAQAAPAPQNPAVEQLKESLGATESTELPF